MKGHTLILIEKNGKMLMLRFKVCHPNSMTTVIFSNRDEKFFNKKKHAYKKRDMTTVEKWSL